MVPGPRERGRCTDAEFAADSSYTRGTDPAFTPPSGFTDTRRFAMAYIEGFVAAVPRGNKDAYQKHAAGAVALFKEFGATRE